MKRIKKWWMAMVLGALLMTILVGVATARPIRQTTYKLTIPGGHFHPMQDGYDWYNYGDYIRLNSGYGSFHAALPIALPGRFTVEKLTLFVQDGNATSDVYASLVRMNPWTGGGETMAELSTSGQSGADPQIISTTNISPDTVFGGHGAYIYLHIAATTNLKVYAVQVEYH